MAYMVGGFLIIWATSFVFIFSMVQRQRNLRREIDTLREVLDAGASNGRETSELSATRAVLR